MLQPWYLRSLPLPFQQGGDLFQALYGNSANWRQLSGPLGWQGIATLLESPYPVSNGLPQARLARYSLCAGPPRTWRGQPRLWIPPVGQITTMLSDRLATPRPESVLLTETGEPWPTALEPFSGGWMGWLGYDLAWELETLPVLTQDELPFPVAFWYEPETFAIADHQQQQLWLAASQCQDLDTMATAIGTHASEAIQPLDVDRLPSATQGLTLESDQSSYEAAVRQISHHIQQGDIFQANLSLRFSTQTCLNSWAIYRRLQAINPSPFASYWRTPWGCVVSCSPERLVSLRGHQVETRPIAGTRSRGATAAADRDLAQELRTNPKEQAEHIMLVDLERNDLGRVCTWGSVQVDEFRVIEPYSHVMHLVSNVVGRLQPDLSAVELIRAVFPGGTITGCPKVRCMEIIEALEPTRRNLFYGSCGYLDWRGHLDLNILIRTLLCAPQPNRQQSRTVWGQVGAGIVADSHPDLEWQESLYKAKAQLLAIGL